METDAIVTEDGVKRMIQVVICATGYATPKQEYMAPTRVFIREDKEDVEVTSKIRSDPQCYLGTINASLPNMFFILGPNSVDSSRQ